MVTSYFNVLKSMRVKRSIRWSRPVGMRQSVPVHPKHFIETDRVHDQGIPFPVADGVPVVAGFQILRMSPSIHIDDPVRMRTSDIEDEDALEFGNVHNLYAVRCDKFPRSTRGLAARMRFIF